MLPRSNPEGSNNAALAISFALLATTTGPALADPIGHRVATTEVTVKPKTADGAWLRDRLIAASTEEARYYDAALPPSTMRIVIDKVSTKNAGKAIASALPLVGMFAGANENRLKGKIELLDGATGKVLKKAKIDCDDYTQFSAADGLLAYADIGTSFLPFGSLISLAADVGRSAANRRTPAQEKLVHGFVMLSYKKLYGNKTYKSFAVRRKADLAATAAARSAPVQTQASQAAIAPVIATASPVAVAAGSIALPAAASMPGSAPVANQPPTADQTVVAQPSS